MFGNLINTEQITHDTIQDFLERIAAELSCHFSDFWVMIKPVSAEFEMKIYIYKMVSGKPELVRESNLKEILNS